MAPKKKDSTKSRANLIDDEALEWLKPRVLIKPEDQENVPEAELEEEIGRVLTTINPQWVPDEVAFHYGQGRFVAKSKPTFGKAYPLYVYQGTAIRKDSDEAKAQIAAGYGMVGFDDAGPKRAKVKKSAAAEEEEEEEPEAEQTPAEEARAEEEALGEEEKYEEREPSVEPTEAPSVTETEVGAENAEEAEPEEIVPEQADDYDEEVLNIKPRVKKLANQFNFCERAALTYIYPRRSVETQTVPPPRANYGSTALQCIIFDYYQEDYAKKMREKEEEKPKRLRKKTTKRAKSAQQIHEEQLAQRIREAWAILERLVNQNIYDDIAQDYRYWDDPSDEFREGMGSLLPLWKFQFEPMRSHAVCDLQWNPHYQDLFAVAYGSLDFTQQQKQGCLCLYSIKNPAYPEYSVITESPIICLDVYKETPYLVRWGARLIDGEASFFSVSGDGRVVQWAVMPGELQATTIIALRSSAAPIAGPDGTLINVNSCGSCICFHPEKSDIFLVGTEDGAIHTCSLKYNRSYVRSCQAHHMPVYRINYNYFNNSIYASCSGDWRVKIWEDGRDDPLFMFELGSPVGDVKWAPYSSTVFAACTADGKKYRPEWENMDEFKGWLKSASGDTSKAFCTYCSTEILAKLFELKKHAEIKKHKQKVEFKTGNKEIPFKVVPKDHLFRSCDESEGALTLFIAEHCSILSVDHLGKLCIMCFKDSKARQELKLHRTKCTEIKKNVLMPHFRKELLDYIGNQKFSIIMDTLVL
ncbi:unnamed protein product [Parnassius apollo]|uniref:(apollo) hypothetical protein n=1 Tax=Parnassius apollo TaxID=110799 RepID=A0A8S3Y6F8_PARAO|nr:unnamed protein product [Parnassius apollo]